MIIIHMGRGSKETPQYTKHVLKVVDQYVTLQLFIKNEPKIVFLRLPKIVMFVIFAKTQSEQTCLLPTLIHQVPHSQVWIDGNNNDFLGVFVVQFKI